MKQQGWDVAHLFQHSHLRHLNGNIQSPIGEYEAFLIYSNQIFIYRQTMSHVPNIKYKTEYCLFWQQAKLCEKGYSCFFAHGDQELRTIQENHKEITMQYTHTSGKEAKQPNYKTVFCKFYAQGQCKLGDECTYAHQRREKRKKKTSQQYQMPMNPSLMNPSSAQQNYEFYNHYIYQQFYQNYAYSHLYGAQYQPESQHYEWQVGVNDHKFYESQVEDINYPAQFNKTITRNNSTEAEQKSQNTLELDNSGEMSPTISTSPVHPQVFPQLKIIKQNEPL